jgi:tight adherence protein B
MMPLAPAALIGLAGGLLVWALRDQLRARFDKDVAWLEHAIWRLSPEPFIGAPWVAAYYAAVAAGIVVCVILPYKFMDILVVVALVLLPRVIIERQWTRRRKAIHEQLPAAVMQMSSSVASGMTLVQAIDRLAERGPSPVRTEFRIMSGQWRLGSDFASVIEEAKRRLGLPSFDLFASAVLVNQRMGGNITETLERLARSLESIDKMQRDIFAATSEGRTNVKVLVMAPLLMLGFVEVVDHEAVALLFTKPVGWALLGTATVLTAVGAVWAWRIAHADV